MEWIIYTVEQVLPQFGTLLETGEILMGTGIFKSCPFKFNNRYKYLKCINFYL